MSLSLSDWNGHRVTASATGRPWLRGRQLHILITNSQSEWPLFYVLQLMTQTFIKIISQKKKILLFLHCLFAPFYLGLFLLGRWVYVCFMTPWQWSLSPTMTEIVNGLSWKWLCRLHFRLYYVVKVCVLVLKLHVVTGFSSCHMIWNLTTYISISIYSSHSAMEQLVKLNH